MDNYIVSARKYRPATFATVVGQSSLTTTLQNAIRTGHLAHAYLFCGPRGVGKTTSARIFAKTINCLNIKENGEACDECESCRAFNEQRSFNIHELDAASNNSVDDIRQLIDQVRIAPQIGKYKVFIIDEVHMLSTAAFNAFLKTLEEPPHHAIFILATTEKHKLLPTILSRCQIYDFNRMTVDGIVGHLQNVAEKEGITYEIAALNIIAQKADGGMRDALSIFDQVAAYCQNNITYAQTIENLGVLDTDYYFRIVDKFLDCERAPETAPENISECMLTLGEILDKGFDGQHFIGGLASHLRNVLMSRDPQTTKLIEASDDVRQRYQEQAQRCKPQFLYNALKLCNDCDLAYRASQNKRLLVELTIIEVAQMAAGEDIVGSGRSPKRMLKPLFARLKTVGGANVSAPTQSAQQPVANPSATQQPQGAMQPRQTMLQQHAPTTARPIPTASTTPIRRTMGFSIRGGVSAQNASPITTAQQVTVATTTATTSDVPLQNKPIDDMNLRKAWREFAQSLTQDEIAMSQRLLNLEPELISTEPPVLEIIADNPNTMQQLQTIVLRIQPFLRQRLSNSSLNINVRIREVTDRKRIYTRPEQYAMMKDMNHAFSKLCDALRLELD